MKKKILAGLITLGWLIVTGCTTQNVQNPQNPQNQDGQATTITLPPPSPLTPEAKPKSPTTPPLTPSTTSISNNKTGPAPLYLEYTLARYNLLKGKQAFVLFFQTSTCSTCKKLDTDIVAKLPIFPRGTQILKVNFDKETALAKTFGVTLKGTMVVLDKTGKVAVKLVNPTIDQFLMAVKKIM